VGDLVGFVEGLDGGSDRSERCDFRAGEKFGFELIWEDEVSVLEEAFIGRYFVFWNVESSFITHYWVQHCHSLLICCRNGGKGGRGGGIRMYPRRMSRALCLRET